MSRFPSLVCCCLGLTLLSASHPGEGIRNPGHQPAATSTQEVLIAAAADLQFAMDSVSKAFSSGENDISIKLVYGSSGHFYEQIINDAPFDIFFSADLGYPEKLEQQHKTLSPVKPYGTGQLVLWSKKLDPSREGMNSLLLSSVTHIAIANPAHAPYGQRAEESLKHYQLYDKVREKLVIGENISQTAQFASTGAADIGIIALSLALSPQLQTEGKYWLIPPDTHQPLKQGFVLLQHAKGNEGANKFAAFIGSAKARAILKYFGFDE
ncbi:MAG TPA: molybdate ABC transporter substrate-binding protein [Puia sp.]|jgi:molybdate transport system substrate-binding protein